MTDQRSPGINSTIGLPPADVVEFFRAKGSYPVSTHWTDVWEEEHARAFTVAKIQNRRLLEDIRGSLDKVIVEGGTFAEWKARILPVLQSDAYKWWGRVDNADLTGVDRPITVDDRRLRTIFDTNIRMARAAGRWKKIEAAKDVAPYLRYSAVMDGRTRPLHALWHATILPVDHPWWNDHYPPNGWHCRCTVTQHSARDLRVRGWKVSEAPPAEGKPQAFRRRGSEQSELVPAGVDPGFAYNVGKFHLAGLAPPTLDRPLTEPRIVGELPAMPSPRMMPAETLQPSDLPSEQAIARFIDRFDGGTDGITKLSRDVTGEPLILTEDFFYDRPAWAPGRKLKLDAGRIASIDLLAEALLQPDEIWTFWAPFNEPDGSERWRIRRRYVARFEIEGRSRSYGVVVETGPAGWQGVTAFMTGDERYVDRRFRGGTLVYRRDD